jgi:hypothetical protein
VRIAYPEPQARDPFKLNYNESAILFWVALFLLQEAKLKLLLFPARSAVKSVQIAYPERKRGISLNSYYNESVILFWVALFFSLC